MGRAYRYQRRLTHIVLSVAEREAVAGLVTKAEEPPVTAKAAKTKKAAEPQAAPKAAKPQATKTKKAEEPQAAPKATKKKASTKA
jgi:large subunit ribosomal protein L22